MMQLHIHSDRHSMSAAAARHAAASITSAQGTSGTARIIAATGASQLEFLAALTALPGIDWSRVELFHLDEYVGIPATHPASFRRYLREHLIDKTGMTAVHLLDVEAGAAEACRVTGEALSAAPVDVAFVGIGENGHLAFNDPPADFDTTDPYILVTLDEACRRQQVGEGWFASVDQVPRTAVSMSVRQILKAREVLVIVPDARKAPAVAATLAGDVSPAVPASILRTHPNVTLYLDEPAASGLDRATRERYVSNRL
jgi:glucosamine-6-phosphate deaminase